MPDNEDQFDREDLGARARERGGVPGGDINFLPSDPVHLGQRVRPASNATIQIAVRNNVLLPLPLPGQHSDVLRDAFTDAVRFYTQDDEVKALLKSLAKPTSLRFEVSANFPNNRPSDDNIAKQLAFSISYLRLPEWEKIQADAISHQACWVTGYGGTTGDSLNFEYCLAVWHDPSGMEDIAKKYQEVQQERRRIDAERDAWIQDQAQPLLDELRDQLLTSSMPEIDREACKKMLDELVTDAYFRNIIDAKQASEMLGLDVSRVRELGREGRFGKRLSTGFIHAIEDIRHFMSKPRETGKHRKS